MGPKDHFTVENYMFKHIEKIFFNLRLLFFAKTIFRNYRNSMQKVSFTFKYSNFKKISISNVLDFLLLRPIYWDIFSICGVGRFLHIDTGTHSHAVFATTKQYIKNNGVGFNSYFMLIFYWILSI